MATSFLSAKNRAVSTLASTLSAGATSLSVATGEGSNFPDPSTDGNFPLAIDEEDLLCTARSGDTLTVERGKNGSSDVEHASGSVVALVVSEDHLQEIHDAVNAIEDKLPVPDSGESGQAIGFSLVSGEEEYLVPKVPARKSIWLTSVGARPRNTNPCADLVWSETGTYKLNYPYLAFDAAASEYAQWMGFVPEDYDGGTLKARLYWNAAQTSGNVVWKLRATSLQDAIAADRQFGTEVSITDATKGTAYQINFADFATELTVGGSPSPGDLWFFEVERAGGNGSDTMTGDARLLGVKLEYTPKPFDES